ncbi:UNVERIFIED_CONTAM: hypothetical protein GTU68_057439 [Idotea baltica]|nr:hypothetical protein [Idotea baltica]
MEEVDRRMINTYGIQLLQMMENAGRSLAVVAREHFLRGNVAGRSVVVLAGTGGNGGGALTAARRLKAWGANVRVVLSKPAPEHTGAAAHQINSLQQMGMVVLLEPPTGSELILDGLVGYSLNGKPRGRIAELIEWTNRQITPVLSLDLPSGLDPDKGMIHIPCIRASATMTLALPKVGLLSHSARPMAGELFLADISVPPTMYNTPGLPFEVAHIFSDGDIIKIR